MAATLSPGTAAYLSEPIVQLLVLKPLSRAEVDSIPQEEQDAQARYCINDELRHRAHFIVSLHGPWASVTPVSLVSSCLPDPRRRTSLRPGTGGAQRWPSPLGAGVWGATPGLRLCGSVAEGAHAGAPAVPLR